MTVYIRLRTAKHALHLQKELDKLPRSVGIYDVVGSGEDWMFIVRLKD
jgi:hypothetical protein